MHSACEALCCGSSSAETSAGLSKFQLGFFSGNLSDDQVVDGCLLHVMSPTNLTKLWSSVCPFSLDLQIEHSFIENDWGDWNFW